MPARAECQAQAEAEIKRWADALGVSGEWRITFTFGRMDTDEALKDSAAAVVFDTIHRDARIVFAETIRPPYYSHEAAHEVLHVFFQPIEAAIDQLNEPAKTLMEDALHSRISRLSRVLSGTAPVDGKEDRKRPPWEADDG